MTALSKAGRAQRSLDPELTSSLLAPAQCTSAPARMPPYPQGNLFFAWNFFYGTGLLVSLPPPCGAFSPPLLPHSVKSASLPPFLPSPEHWVAVLRSSEMPHTSPFRSVSRLRHPRGLQPSAFIRLFLLFRMSFPCPLASWIWPSFLVHDLLIIFFFHLQI